MVQDLVSDFCVRLNNAKLARLPAFEMPASKVVVALAKVLQDVGYVEKVRLVRSDNRLKLHVDLKWVGRNESPIHGIKRVSKPGLRRYSGYVDLKKWPVLNGLGVAVVSTSSGVMTDKEAIRRKLGGEVLCQVW